MTNAEEEQQEYTTMGKLQHKALGKRLIEALRDPSLADEEVNEIRDRFNRGRQPPARQIARQMGEEQGMACTAPT